MKPIINIEAFRQYYEEAVNCKTVLNANAENLSLDDDFRSSLIGEDVIQNVLDGFVSDSSVKVGKLRCEQNRRFLAHRSQSLDKRCLAAVAMPHVPADSTHTVSLCPQDLKILIRGVRPNHSRDF